MKETKICVIGLGYVGLPLARLFSTKFETIGFDMNQRRVDALMTGHDATLEVSDELLQDAIKNHGFRCTTDLEEIKKCNFYVVACPLPWMPTTVLTCAPCGVLPKPLVRSSAKVTWWSMRAPSTQA